MEFIRTGNTLRTHLAPPADRNFSWKWVDFPRVPGHWRRWGHRYLTQLAARVTAIRRRAARVARGRVHVDRIWRAIRERVGKPRRSPADATRVIRVARVAPAQAGIDGPPFEGAHLLRQALAAAMLGKGASFEDDGQILRRHHPKATRTHAKSRDKATQSRC